MMLTMLRKILNNIKSHPHFAAIHPELVKQVEDDISKMSSGSQLDLSVVLQLVMMILQMLSSLKGN